MSNNKTPIVIAGANGRVANHLAKMLLAKGHIVKAISRDVSKIKALKQNGATLVEADFFDSAALRKAFTGSETVFVYSPLILHSQNLNEDQFGIINSLIKAIKNSGVKNVVLLSSWGVELSEKSGGILGCQFFEQELEKIHGINTLILRPVWFMENFVYNIGLIKMAGINGLAIKPDVKFPMVTTDDIAAAAFEYLDDVNFEGRNIIYIKSQKEYSMKEVSEILGKTVGIQKLKYVEFPLSVQKQGMVASGQLSPNAADMLIEINQCISKGILKVDSTHKIKNTPTTLEVFAKREFALAYANAPNPGILAKFQGVFLKMFIKIAGKKMVLKENYN
ncbi:MAG: NmrA family NAD(P)-binding protein [Bacteroidetes bacterium]|nr:NmrA family NAD(P)-binding protein [Bacteroidota bacterium]